MEESVERLASPAVDIAPLDELAHLTVARLERETGKLVAMARRNGWRVTTYLGVVAEDFVFEFASSAGDVALLLVKPGRRRTADVRINGERYSFKELVGFLSHEVR